MLRRLLACLALLTGLVAVGAPAHAAVSAAVAAQIEQTQQADEAGRTVPVTCAERQRQQRLRGDKVTPCRPAEPITIYIPTVQFGPDRAFE